MAESEEAKPKHWSCHCQTELWFCVILTLCAIGLCQGDTSTPESIPITCGLTKCYRGECVNATLSQCKCDPGWTGSKCDTCGGRVRLRDTSGYILESYGNYSLDTKCSWLIQGIPNTTIRLRFDHFATECSWDHLYIYDGNSVYSSLLAVLSGLVISENQVNKTIPEVTATSGSMYLHFYSDAAYNMSGFNITYQMFGCPYDCSGHGVCDAASICTCNVGWAGPGCNIPECRNDCGGHGTCQEGYCDCQIGYRGDDCSVADTEGVWEVVHQNFPGDIPIAGRASHQSVVLDGMMWVASGDDFGHRDFQQLASFEFNSRTWQYHNVNSHNRQQPSQRYGHSLVVHERKLYMFGGLKRNIITNELWVYNTDTHVWDLRHPHAPQIQDAYLQNEVIGVVGHTAHVINNIMYVIFGHSPVYGYMNTVQECNLANANLTWNLAETAGATVKGGYGHSSVYDEIDGLIYIHAGYHSGSSSAYYLSDSLYSYHPVDRYWRILRSSGQYKYLHSAVIISGLMLVFGGNTHNDTSISKGAKCYSTDFLAYDMECDKWYTLEAPNLMQDISRFGHSASVYDEAMYVFGGFNGLMLNDMYKYMPGKCDSYNTQVACLTAFPGVQCVWAEEQDSCMTREQAEEARNQKVNLEYITAECETNMMQSDVDCQSFRSCPSCVENPYECSWCQNACENDGGCRTGGVSAYQFEDCEDHFQQDSLECENLHNCHACEQNRDCDWSEEKKCGAHLQDDDEEEEEEEEEEEAEEPECSPPCFNYTNCEECTSTSCMWCSNQKRCVESNSYVASFPYGQCMEWTTQKAKCPATRCKDLQTCMQCQKNPACGWCDDGQNVGLGSCMEGGADGPMDINGTVATPNPGLCPKLGERWFFVECPVCQCNGHSPCYEGSEVCEECQDNTDGPQCQHCKEGFYGQATNGGNCTACECNDQTDICHRQSGKCYCRTRGVTGDHCEMCDEGHKYVGNPQNGGTCYYNLQIDFQFTFNLSKEEDHYFTQINFMNTPTSHDRDTEFNINCSAFALLNITVKSNSQPAERVLVGGVECGTYKTKFSHKDHVFGRDTENTTFYVYVYNFQTPFSLQISFSQFPQIDLVHFFVTFFSCFLSLLLIAAILWKVKQRYDLIRRRQRCHRGEEGHGLMLPQGGNKEGPFLKTIPRKDQLLEHVVGLTVNIMSPDDTVTKRMFVEMEQMASRPFAACAIEIVDKNPPLQTKKEPPDTRASRRKKTFKPSPIALEPLHGHKAAILSLILQLPTGDEDYTPPGQAGLIMGSSLVTLGHPRKASMEGSKSDKVKFRKSASTAGPENCL